MNAHQLPSNEAVIARFEPWTGTAATGYVPTFFGAQTAVLFYAHWLRKEQITEALSGPRRITVPVPAFQNGEMFFEQANIAKSLLFQRPADDNRFIVVELGGGHGPRAVDSALALRQLRPDLKPFLVVVEALPVYVDWAKHHFMVNGLRPDDHWIIPAIVAAKPIPALFDFQPNGFGNQLADTNVAVRLASVLTDCKAALKVLNRLSGSGSVSVKSGGAGWNRFWARPTLVEDSSRTKAHLQPESWTPDGILATAAYSLSTSEIGLVSALTLPTILAPLPYVDSWTLIFNSQKSTSFHPTWIC